MNNQILPVIDIEKLQQAANEFAMKGALKTLEDFYTGYNSPYRKAIEDNLNGKGVESYKMELPDIIAVLNESISNEIDAIANTAIAKTFVPLVSKFLTRQEKEIKMSDILKQFVETAATYKGPDRDDYNLQLNFNSQYKWYEMEITDGIRAYTATLHCVYATRDLPLNQRKYQFLSLPNDGNAYKHSMKLSCDGCTLELPFVKDVLKDEFQSYIAGLLIASSEISLDIEYFEEWILPDHGCHC
ncbi:hypothetical protein [Pedobacter nototheniae]|uniref:hypothetical protein n=1 Tax=Pedobacter nototheniae TaxID=2488994 RepID=UPI0010394095|nr:hypothetical protein [Pedobacter nototheniae]